MGPVHKKGVGLDIVLETRPNRINNNIREIQVCHPGHACAFCHSNAIDELNYGPLYTYNTLTIHHHCMIFSSALEQKGENDLDGLLGFLIQDLHKEIRRSTKLSCKYCRKKGASIGCNVNICKTSFHFTCGLNKGCNFDYTNFTSLCPRHRPSSNIPEAVQDHGCPICNELVLESPVVICPPCCSRHLFHRQCMQRSAVSSGLDHFKCPMCNNNGEEFKNAMKKIGIYIPTKDSDWELEPGAFQDHYEQYSTCDAINCLSTKGRNYSDKKNWFLLRCCTCGSSAVHSKCARLKSLRPHMTSTKSNNNNSWTCDTCSPIVKDSLEDLMKRLSNSHSSSSSNSSNSNSSSSENEEEETEQEKETSTTTVVEDAEVEIKKKEYTQALAQLSSNTNTDRLTTTTTTTSSHENENKNNVNNSNGNSDGNSADGLQEEIVVVYPYPTLPFSTLRRSPSPSTRRQRQVLQKLKLKNKIKTTNTTVTEVVVEGQVGQKNTEKRSKLQNKTDGRSELFDEEEQIFLQTPAGLPTTIPPTTLNTHFSTTLPLPPLQLDLPPTQLSPPPLQQQFDILTTTTTTTTTYTFRPNYKYNYYYKTTPPKSESKRESKSPPSPPRETPPVLLPPPPPQQQQQQQLEENEKEKEKEKEKVDEKEKESEEKASPPPSPSSTPSRETAPPLLRQEKEKEKCEEKEKEEKCEKNEKVSPPSPPPPPSPSPSSSCSSTSTPELIEINSESDEEAELNLESELVLEGKHEENHQEAKKEPSQQQPSKIKLKNRKEEKVKEKVLGLVVREKKRKSLERSQKKIISSSSSSSSPINSSTSSSEDSSSTSSTTSSTSSSSEGHQEVITLSSGDEEEEIEVDQVRNKPRGDLEVIEVIDLVTLDDDGDDRGVTKSSAFLSSTRRMLQRKIREKNYDDKNVITLSSSSDNDDEVSNDGSPSIEIVKSGSGDGPSEANSSRLFSIFKSPRRSRPATTASTTATTTTTASTTTTTTTSKRARLS